MEIFSIYDNRANIKVYSELDYNIVPILKQLFNGYMDIGYCDFKSDYELCIFKNTHNIVFPSELNGYKIGVFSEKRKIYTVVENDNIDNNCLYIKRIIESLKNRILEEKGACFFHGASISIDGNAAIFLGDNNSGKTTTILNYLSSQRAKYMSNSKLALIQENDAIKVIGNATNIGVRISTLEENVNFHKLMKSDLCTSSDYRIVLPVSKLKEYFKTETEKEARLKWIFFIDRTQGDPILHKITEKGVITDLLKSQIVDGVSKKSSIINEAINIKKVNNVEEFELNNVEIYYLIQNKDCTNIIKSIIESELERE